MSAEPPRDKTDPSPASAAAPPEDDTHAMEARFQRRAALQQRYSLLRTDVWQTVQERQRALIQLLLEQGLTELGHLRVLEVGCGAGGNLLDLIRMGFGPQHLSGIELLSSRIQQARSVLPAAVQLIEGDAAVQPIEPASLDIVLQSTVFSSLLDPRFQHRLAEAMWSWVKPGGGVLWYDFTVNNPRNPDVRGIPLTRVRQLFPQAQASHRRVTLAPPLARRVCRVHPGLYHLFNCVPLLRTHVLVWLRKPLPG